MAKIALLGIALFTAFAQGLWSNDLGVDALMLVDPFLVLALLVVRRRRGRGRGEKIAMLAATVWVGWELLGTAESIRPLRTLGDVSISFRCLMIFWLVARIRSWRMAAVFRDYLVLTAVLQSLLALAQWRLGVRSIPFFHSSPESWRSSGTMPYSTCLGLYLAMVSHAALAAGLVDPRRSFRYLFATGLCVLALFTTYNRASWVAFAATLPVPLFWATRVHHVRIRRALRIVVPVGLVGVTLLVIKYGQVILERMSFRMRETLVGDEPQSRLNLIRDGLRIIRERPLFGTTKTNYRFYADPDIPGLRYAHNVYVFIAAETGLVCLIAMLTLLGCAFIAAVRGLRERGGEIQIRGALVGSTAGILVFCISGLATPDYHLAQIRFILWAWLGLHFTLCYLLHRSRTDTPGRQVRKGRGRHALWRPACSEHSAPDRHTG